MIDQSKSVGIMSGKSLITLNTMLSLLYENNFEKMVHLHIAIITYYRVIFVDHFFNLSFTVICIALDSCLYLIHSVK